MRLLMIVLAAFLINCGDSNEPASLDASIGDMSPRRPDCGSLIDCACQDGTCEQVSGCGGTSCADVCATHGGVLSAGSCDELDGGAH